jgi:flavin-dependent dehydrogenase
VDETEEAGEQVYEKRQVEKDKATDAVVHDAAVEGEGQEAEGEVAIDAHGNDRESLMLSLLGGQKPTDFAISSARARIRQPRC